MHLSRLIIKNYRSIRSIDLKFFPGKNVIVGKNNAGKSNVIKAIDILLGEKSPTYNKTDNISEADFFCKKITDQNGVERIESKNKLYLYCELARNSTTSLNFTEINKCSGFYKLLDRKDRGSPNFDTELRLDSIEDSNSFLEFAKNVFSFDLDSPTFDKLNKTRWIDSKISNQRKFSDELNNKYRFAFILKAEKNIDGSITKEMRFLYRENDTVGWNLAFMAPIRNELLQSAVIPSFRDPDTQLRLNSWSWYGKLIKHITENNTNTSDLQDAFLKVKSVADGIFSDAKQEIQNSTLNIAFPGSEIFFQFNNDIKTEVYKNCCLYIDDGIKSPLFDKGSGIQSATIIGLFSYYTNQINTRTHALLCVEEPELYLHPHARRVVSDKLDDFAGTRNQVIVSTHSPEFIKSNSGKINIVLANRSPIKGTRAKNLNIGSKSSLLLNNTYNEIFFADAVIICEGEEDQILKWVAQEELSNKLDEKNISIISAGGKDNLINLFKLVRGIGIKCFIFTDFDFFLRDQSDDVNNYPGAKKHLSIQNLTKEYFQRSYIFGNTGEEVFNKILDFRQNIKRDNEKLFYKAKDIGEIPDNDDLVEFIKELRLGGIGILNCDFEKLSKDLTFLAPNTKKLSLDKIFKISKKIISGEKLSDIIETPQIKTFLEAVISKTN